MLTPRAVVMTLVSVLASLFIRLGYRLPMVLVAVLLVLLVPAWTQMQLGLWTFGDFWFLASLLVIGAISSGLSTPSSSNAALDLAPDKAAALTGIRSMFRLTGALISISGVVAALTFFPDHGRGLAMIFAFLAVPVLFAAPLALLIPAATRQRTSAPSPRPCSAAGCASWLRWVYATSIPLASGGSRRPMRG